VVHRPVFVKSQLISGLPASHVCPLFDHRISKPPGIMTTDALRSIPLYVPPLDAGVQTELPTTTHFKSTL
jgi:hypothetical protein